MTHRIIITSEVLSDGSTVFDVHLSNLSFPCITEDDARALAEKLGQAIETHTNDSVVQTLLT
jgi:hypothetical protein